MTMEVTLDDNGADITAFRLDIVFDNDLIGIEYQTLSGCYQFLWYVTFIQFYHH